MKWGSPLVTSKHYFFNNLFLSYNLNWCFPSLHFFLYLVLDVRKLSYSRLFLNCLSIISKSRSAGEKLLCPLTPLYKYYLPMKNFRKIKKFDVFMEHIKNLGVNVLKWGRTPWKKIVNQATELNDKLALFPYKWSINGDGNTFLFVFNIVRE